MVVVVMVLSRARQCSEERDFGNEWPDGRAPVCCTVKSPVRQIRASFAYCLLVKQEGVRVGRRFWWCIAEEKGGGGRS